MTFVTGLAPCISVVRRDLFQLTQFASGLLVSDLAYSQHLSHLIPPFWMSRSWVAYCSKLSHVHIRFIGLALGGVWGLREGARRPLAVSNARLRINSVLNSVTRRGTFIGNSAGVMGAFSFFSFSTTLPHLA